MCAERGRFVRWVDAVDARVTAPGGRRARAAAAQAGAALKAGGGGRQCRGGGSGSGRRGALRLIRPIFAVHLAVAPPLAARRGRRSGKYSVEVSGRAGASSTHPRRHSPESAQRRCGG